MKVHLRSLLGAAFLALPLMAGAAPWKIYLLFGQSNMTGGQAPGPEDVFNNPRVKVLAYNNCSGRAYNEWYMATGALHCTAGFGIGDWFAKVVADSLKQDTLALIPCAIAGVPIDFFQKGVVSPRRKEFSIPPDNHWDGAYPWVVSRLQIALQKGQMAGILLHQGEADWSSDLQKAWQGKVLGIYSDLKKELGFGDVPFLIGELRADAAACCGGNNAYIAQTAKALPQGYVISSANLTVNNDPYHFNGNGLREFGKRYAASYLQAVKAATGLARGEEGLAPAAWRVQTVAGARMLEFDRSQETIVVQDLRGRVVARGKGLAVRLPPASAQAGLLFFRAQAGDSRSEGALAGLR
jgi:Carbohydrate esterase, sialic acid-specific acetylesterase